MTKSSVQNVFSFATQSLYSKAFTSHAKDSKTLVSNFLLYGSEKLSFFLLSSISPLLSILLILMFLFLTSKNLLNHVTLPNDQLLLFLSLTTKALESIY